MRRLWIVTELYWPDETSTAYFLTGIAEGIAGDADVQVICGRPRGRRLPAREARAGVVIRRCWSTRFARHSLPLRVLNVGTLTFSVLVTGLRHFRRGDSVLVVTNPPTLPMAVVAAARCRRASATVLVHDVYPEVLAIAQIVEPRTARYRLLDAASKLILRSAAGIVVLGRDMRRVIVDKLAGAPIPVAIIHNWGEIDEMARDPNSGNPLRRRLGISDDDFVVGFSGNMGRTHDLLSVLAAAEQLGSQSGVRFVLIGEGAAFRAVEARLAAGDLPHVALLPWQPRESLPVTLGLADVALITFLPGMAGISVPSRLYNALAAGRPVVAACDPDSEPAAVIAEAGAGWVVPPGDVDALARVLRQAHADPQVLAAMGARARQAAGRYTRSVAIAAYRRLFGLEEARSAIPSPN